MGNEISEKEKKQHEYKEQIKQIDKVLLGIWAHKQGLKHAEDAEGLKEEYELLDEEERKLKQTKHELELLIITGKIASVSTSKLERANHLKENIVEIKAKDDVKGDGVPRKRKKKLNLPDAPSNQANDLSLEERFKNLT